MNIKDIEAIMHEIQVQYGNGKYMRISGDTHLNFIPRNLWKLWYSDNQNSLAVKNMDDLVAKAMQGKVNPQEAYIQMRDLRDALAHEFELINQGTRKEY